MDQIKLTADLLADGWSTHEIVRLARAGELERVRRRAYDQAPAAELGQVEQHRRLIAATVRQTSGSGVVSDMSAAVLHRLPTWRKNLTWGISLGTSPAVGRYAATSTCTLRRSPRRMSPWSRVN